MRGYVYLLHCRQSIVYFGACSSSCLTCAQHPQVALGFLHHVLSTLPQVIKENVKYELRYEAKADAVRLCVVD